MESVVWILAKDPDSDLFLSFLPARRFEIPRSTVVRIRQGTNPEVLAIVLPEDLQALLSEFAEEAEIKHPEQGCKILCDTINTLLRFTRLQRNTGASSDPIIDMPLGPDDEDPWKMP